jgi:predicted nucleic acid-binding protein
MHKRERSYRGGPDLKDFVLDASVALRWFLDPAMPVYAKRVRAFLLEGARAAVPALWHLEMSNGLVVAERRSILTTADVDQAMIDLEQVVAQAVDTDSVVVSVRQSLVTARDFELSAYDAAYLDLARRERLPLATLDDRLRGAAKRAGVALVR